MVYSKFLIKPIETVLKISFFLLHVTITNFIKKMDYEYDKPETFIIPNMQENKQAGNYHNVLEVKKTMILMKIQIERKLASEKIANKISEIWRRKKKLIINKILHNRNKCANLIQANWKKCKIRSLVKSIIEKNKTCFCVSSNIKNVAKLDLKIYSTNPPKHLNFNYCYIRKSFVLYIPKSVVRNTVLRVNFIADDKIFIDPGYRTDYDSNGNFYNLLDFRAFEEYEKERSYELDQIKFDICRRLTPTNEDFSKNMINRNFTINFMRNTIPYIKMNLRTVTELPNLKPCLKTSESYTSLNGEKRKRVSFCHNVKD
jgi:hypothetical protein